MKITEETTLGALTILVNKLGVSSLRMAVEGGLRCAIVDHPTYGQHMCVADSESTALDGAFARLIHTIGSSLEAALS